MCLKKVRETRWSSQVLREFDAWLRERGLLVDGDDDEARPAFVIATDGPWDMRKFLVAECLRKKLPTPPHFLRWVDISLHLSKWRARSATTTSLSLSLFGARAPNRMTLSGSLARATVSCGNSRRCALARDAAAENPPKSFGSTSRICFVGVCVCVCLLGNEPQRARVRAGDDASKGTRCGASTSRPSSPFSACASRASHTQASTTRATSRPARANFGLRTSLENLFEESVLRDDGLPDQARLALRLLVDGCALFVNDGWGEWRVKPPGRTTDQKREARRRARTTARDPHEARKRREKLVKEVDW